MKQLLLVFAISSCLLRGAELAGVHTVYMLPMSRGLDQYLANSLTNTGVFRVVTDPKLADAVFTDRIGEDFQTKLEEISPAPAPSQPDKEEEPAAKESQGPLSLLDTVNLLPSMASSSTFGRGKGTVFLVDAKSRQVVWSIYEVPKSTSSADMNRTASDIVSRLKRDLEKK